MYEAGSPFNVILSRDARSHFEHAQGVDPDNAVARGFLERVTDFFPLAIRSNT